MPDALSRSRCAASVVMLGGWVAAGAVVVWIVGWLSLTGPAKAFDRAVFDAIVPALQSIPGAVTVSRRLTDIGAIPVNYGMALGIGGVLWAQRRLIAAALVPMVLVVGHGIQWIMVRSLDGIEPDEHVIGASGPYFSGGVMRVVLLVAVGLIAARPDMNVARVARWAVAIGGVEAVTRLVLGRHWPIDLLASFPIGLGLAELYRHLVVLFDRGSTMSGSGGSTGRPSGCSS